MNQINHDKLSVLFNELVPSKGKADSLAGEIVRATSRIGYRFFNDGDQIGIGYGKETCNAAARFLMEFAGEAVDGIVSRLWGLYDEKQYEYILDEELIPAVVAYIEKYPEKRHQETPDMFSYYDKYEDVDDSDDESDDEDSYWDDEDEEDY